MGKIGVLLLLLGIAGLWLGMGGRADWLSVLAAGDVSGAAALIEAWGPWAVAASLGLSVLIALGAVIPSIALSGANVLIFGPLGGGLISWLGEVLGAAVAFWLYRFFGIGGRGDGVKAPILPKAFREMEGWRWVLVARMAPLVPSGVVTLGAAATGVAFWPFTGATAVGKIPAIALEVLVAYELLAGDHPLWIASGLTLIGMGWLWIKSKRPVDKAD